VSIHFPSKIAAVWAVAPKLGIDLSGAIRDDLLTPDDLGSMMSNCASCWHTRKCARWMDNAGGAPMADFCASGAALNDLAARAKGAGAAGH